MNHIQFTRRLGALMAAIGFALTVTVGGWSLGALLAFGLFIGGLIYLVNRETMHTLDETDRELARRIPDRVPMTTVSRVSPESIVSDETLATRDLVEGRTESIDSVIDDLDRERDEQRMIRRLARKERRSGGPFRG